MSDYFDWARLAEMVEPKRDSQRLSWEESKHLFKKVAWDVYKPVDGTEALWEMRVEDDGSKYLVAMYNTATVTASAPDGEDAKDSVIVTASSDWNAICDRARKNVTLSFKGFPIKRFASSEYRFSQDEADQFAKFIQSRASDSEFTREILKDLPIESSKIFNSLGGKK